jgi:hypothetical protein
MGKYFLFASFKIKGLRSPAMGPARYAHVIISHRPTQHKDRRLWTKCHCEGTERWAVLGAWHVIDASSLAAALSAQGRPLHTGR